MLLAFGIVSILAARTTSAPQDTVPWKAVEIALGRSGTLMPGGVYRFAFPRSDLTITLDGVTIRPALALGSWAGFLRTGDGAIVMGDLVLRESELPIVATKLQEGGIHHTAIHNHLVRESPPVKYLHFHGAGNPVALASALRDALALTQTPGPSAAAPPALALDTTAIASALGVHGRPAGGVYQMGIARTEVVRVGRLEIPPSMGLSTAVNWQATGPNTAAITGDFVLLASEIAPVGAALRQAGIEVTAIHNHLIDEEPRLFFMHFWANDDPLKLARGLRSALDKTNSKRP